MPERRPAKPVGFSIRNTFAYDSKFVCSKGCFSQKIKVFAYSLERCGMMIENQEILATLQAKIGEFNLK